MNRTEIFTKIKIKDLHYHYCKIGAWHIAYQTTHYYAKKQHLSNCFLKKPRSIQKTVRKALNNITIFLLNYLSEKKI